MNPVRVVEDNRCWRTSLSSAGQFLVANCGADSIDVWSAAGSLSEEGR